MSNIYSSPSLSVLCAAPHYVPLTDICQPKQWKTIPKAELKTNGYPVYGANGIIGYSDEYNHENRTILIACRGASCGAINVCSPKSYVTGNAMCLDNLDEEFDLDFLQHYLQTYDFKKAISGSAQPQITRSGLSSIMIPILPANLQSKISCILNAVDENKKQVEQTVNYLDSLIKSRFIEMFGESDDCEEVAFGDACVFLRNGATIKQSKNAGGIPITRIETISNNCINEDKFGYANIFDTKAYEKHIMKPGDLLISHINSLPYLGRTVWYHGKPETVIHGMNLLRARLTQEFLPCFVEKYMTTRKAKSYINRHAKKSVNQASISATDLKKMPLPKPSVSKQQEFADFVSQVDKLRFEACYAMYLLCAAFTLL